MARRRRGRGGRSTWWRSRPTSSAAPRAPARSSCAAASRSSRCSKAAVRSGGCAPARPTSPARSRWPLRCGSRARSAPPTSPGSPRLRDRLLDGLLASVPDAFENGDRAAKVAGNAHVGFRGVEAETLLVALDRADVCAAAGSSCSSGATEPSHVLDGDGHHARRRALVDPPEPRLRVDRARRRRRARRHPARGGAAPPRRAAA